jgi:phytoene desaturase
MQRRLGSRFGTVVIVGGGVSGLAAGCLLAGNGFAVRLFEANSKLGGCCATTSIDGYTFNDGAVYLPMIRTLDSVFARLGIQRADVLPVRKIKANFTATLWDRSVVTLSDGMDISVQGRDLDRTRLEAELQALISTWVPVLQLVSDHLINHPFSAWRLLRHGWRYLHKLRGTLASELAGSVTDDAIRATLSGALLYGGLPPELTPVITIIGLIDMMTEGFYLPEGGMGRVPDALSVALKKHGGEICLNSRVERILLRNGRISGLDIKGQGRVDAAAVISTATAMSTFTSLMAEEDVPSLIRRKIKRARLSHKAVSIQFGLSNAIQARSHLNMVLPPMERQRELFTQPADAVTLPIYFVPTVTMPKLAPPGGSVIEMFHPVADNISVASWDDNKKQRLSESAFRALSRTYDLNVVVARVRSPKDFMDTMHLYRGALYGLTPAAGPRERFAHTTPVPGLFLAGQSTYPGYGVAASIMSGIFAAQALMDGCPQA